jgi:hypothetical protein
MWVRCGLVLVVISACGGSTRSSAVSNAGGRDDADADAHGSRDALVRATFARMGAGDVAGLIELATKRSAYERALACTAGPDDETEGLREALAPAAQNGKGHTIEVLQIDLAEPVSTMAAGEKFSDSCTTKVAIHWHSLNAKLRVRGAGGGAPREATAWVNVFDIGGRWYLAAVQQQLDGK